MPLVTYPSPLSNPRALVVVRYGIDVVLRYGINVVVLVPLDPGCNFLKIITLWCGIIPAWGRWRRWIHLRVVHYIVIDDMFE